MRLKEGGAGEKVYRHLYIDAIHLKYIDIIDAYILPLLN